MFNLHLTYPRWSAHHFFGSGLPKDSTVISPPTGLACILSFSAFFYFRAKRCETFSSKQGMNLFLGLSGRGSLTYVNETEPWQHSLEQHVCNTEIENEVQPFMFELSDSQSKVKEAPASEKLFISNCHWDTQKSCSHDLVLWSLRNGLNGLNVMDWGSIGWHAGRQGTTPGARQSRLAKINTFWAELVHWSLGGTSKAHRGPL